MENPMQNTGNHDAVGRGKAVAYSRVSTAERTERERPSAQIAAIRRYAQDQGFELTGEFIEGDATGTDDNRPELRRMFHDILQPNSEVGTIIVTCRSRFMRDALTFGVHQNALREGGIRLLAIQQEASGESNEPSSG